MDTSVVLGNRFWSKVTKTDGCWQWNACKNPKGYGEFRYERRKWYAHRLAYTEANGSIPAGAFVDHLCYNKSCVNPDHMRITTNTYNVQNRGKLNRNNTSGVRGVTWSKQHRKWLAQAKLNRKHNFIGLFDDIADAEAAVIAWRRENMPHSLSDRDLAA